MSTITAFRAFGVSALIVGCAAAPEPTEPIGDVGDTANEVSTSACNLSRDSILNSVSGGRRTAIERGFTWYDAQVPYSQSSQYDGYRTDCSGFVSMCWQLGSSYTTANFIQDTNDWTSLGSFEELVPADAMVYRSGGAGHIVMFVGWNDSAHSEACVLEQASTASDMQFRARPVSSLLNSGYHAIRATKFGSSGGSADDPNQGAQCFCDSECSQYGDCCSNCGGGSGGGTGSGTGGTSGSGSGTGGTSGSSGSSGGQCFCDSACVQNGDCCASCPGGSGGSSGSGAGGSSGSGGSSGGQCFCDALCAQNGDCCASCPGGSGGSSGSGSGGSSGSGGQCYCDLECFIYGDCCDVC
ncbi:MAG: hypothetical protein R3B13_17665 [Polyangiaceae bacterium]